MKTNIVRIIFLLTLIYIEGSVQVFAQKEGVVTIESSERIKEIISKKRTYNKNLKEVKGFKIQLFNGSEQGAYKIRDEFSTIFPKTDIKIQFFSPEWKVRVGNYKTRLEADRALVEIKKDFPSAIILPAMIEL